MEKRNRSGCKDVFHMKYLEKTQCRGKYDFPVIKQIRVVPRRYITFSKAMREKKDFHQWVCFYENDFEFERLWNCPSKYLNRLRKFDGVITPDYSCFYDMPLAMQLWNIFRSRTIGAWLQKQGLKVIPNIRFGDERTFDCCCDGVSRHGVISMGTLGCLKDIEYRSVFISGIERVIELLEPETIIFYGSIPSIVDKIKAKGINVVVIKPESFHKKEVKG